MIDGDPWYAQYSCPVCGGRVIIESDCPGYPGRWNGRETILVCNPPQWCGNAYEFRCETCVWWHRSPNRRSTDGMGVKPEWLEECMAGMP